MILPNPKETIHRGQLYRLLISIADDTFLAENLVFKGGTCAALLNKLDRFSVDLDFDIKKDADFSKVSKNLKRIFSALSLTVKNKSKNMIQYYLKYDAPAGLRNTLRLDAVNIPFKTDIFKPMYLTDIDRYMTCQTIETMFAHKLVAVTDRYTRHHSIAGRDIYDIHYFFINGYRYNKEIIYERTSLKAEEYLAELKEFIERKVTETVINEDINTILPYTKFSAIRKSLKSEVLSWLKDEIERYSSLRLNTELP